MSVVALMECTDYDRQAVYAAVKSAVESAGGLDVLPGETVLVKANLVCAQKPETMATTHPSVVEAVARLVTEKGGTPIIGDSPGATFTKQRLTSVYNATGMTELSERTGVALNWDFSSQTVNFENGVALKKFDAIGAGVNADKIINVAKFKTHTFTGVSGATKNMFGMIPGLKKVEMHGSHTELSKFCDLLIDIQEYFSPKTVMHVVDAVTGMEGQGPTGGNPRHIGRIIAGKNPYECDLVGLAVTNNDYRKIVMMTLAIDRGLSDPAAVEVVGKTVEESLIADYDNVVPMPDTPLKSLPNWVQHLMFRHCTRRPVIPKSKCRGCGKCFEHCPPKAISMEKGKAEVNFKKCIRCFCCQELCPFHIVTIKTPLLARFMNRLS